MVRESTEERGVTCESKGSQSLGNAVKGDISKDEQDQVAVF